MAFRIYHKLDFYVVDFFFGLVTPSKRDELRFFNLFLLKRNELFFFIFCHSD